ncbi:hypothetical protein HYALB_00012509 [Hymenoscyphus albidus]|uniref:Uncharacterized protein n=1 Tax=Hymenoscyphus albidus TaxID=595503 RepID=A0A9N9LN70_9HELO|nr:hypothetical protein HYALB_00012509 [Hymenoscyphus albidus]
MQIRNLLVLAALATGVYSAGYGSAYCQFDTGESYNMATENACDTLKDSGCDDCKKVGNPIRCISTGKKIDPHKWEAGCIRNGAKSAAGN